MCIFPDSFHSKSVYSLTIVFVLFLGLMLTGCASKNVKEASKTVHEAYEIQKPLQVWTSEDDKRPEWTKVITSEEDGKIYFTGSFLNGSDYPVSIRCAYAEALKSASQSISQFIRVEFSEHVQGSNTDTAGVDRWVSDGIAVFVDNLQMQGARQREVYYEEMFSPALMMPTYNVFVRVEMAKIDYLQAKAEVLRRLRDRLLNQGRTEAKKKAEQLLEDLKRKINASA